MDEGKNSEGAVLFRSLLDQIGETESSLAKLMVDMGDDRQDSTILRGIQRISSGEARFSGEMRVLMNMIRALRRRVNVISMEKDWFEEADGSVTGVTADGFRVRIFRQSKGRWSSSITYLPTGYCPEYPRWQYSLLGAQEAALRRIEEARSASGWDRGDELIFVSLQGDEFYAIREWMRGEIDKTPKHIDDENAARTLEILKDAFLKHGLIFDEHRLGDLSLQTIKFSLTPHDGQVGVAIRSRFFKNPPTNLKRLPL